MSGGRPGGGGEDPADRPPAPAFSGASPAPGGSSPPGDLLSVVGDPEAAPHVDLAAVRSAVVALVRAALAQDGTGAGALLEQLAARGADESGMASVIAMAALGDRLVTAAGFAAGGAPPGSGQLAAVVAQGDTVAGRADALLRAVAPHCSRDLVRLVVRFACGVPEQDPRLAHLLDAPPEDLTLVAAVLLAQTVLDGAGDADALAAELEQLLPG